MAQPTLEEIVTTDRDIIVLIILRTFSETSTDCYFSCNWLWIMLLLSTQLFGDKTAAQVSVGWIPFMDQLDDLGKFNRGSTTLA
ncbi:hypothetical protein PIB30_022706 [Stylosanthes scabra]|uniref:Uncharacterized protein n=1 Tax=Stylosanthes scabra TaxID=79078 RepID=A0ABU6X7I8_9FABA|nr:hypothetical protein [Stylosanthes scabra]